MMHALPLPERPRERFESKGPDALSAPELLAVLLGSGTHAMPVMQLAHQLLMRFGDLTHLADATLEELQQVEGIGKAKAIQLKAAFSLGRRAVQSDTCIAKRIDTPHKAFGILAPLFQGEKRELIIALLLDVKKAVIATPVIAIGTLSQTLVHPRELFYPAIRHKAAALVLAHNHPSGDPTPSQADLRLTSELVQAGKLMGIPLDDHLIVAGTQYTSLRQQGFEF